MKRRVSLSMIGSLNPLKLTAHLSDPPSGNIELDPTPPRTKDAIVANQGRFFFAFRDS